MKALVGAFNQEKALVGAFSVIVQPVVEQMEHYTALTQEEGGEEEDEDNFDYCWEQSMDQSSPTPARPIPGHTRPKPAAKVGLYLDIEQRNT